MRHSPLLLLAVSLLGALAAAAAEPQKAKAPKPTAEILTKGRASFEANCASCHGSAGDGTGAAALYLTPKPRHFGKDAFKQGNSVEQIYGTLQTGVNGTAMVAFAHLADDERWSIAWYVAHFVPTAEGKKAKKIVDALPPAVAPGAPGPAPAPAAPAAPVVPPTGAGSAAPG